MLKPLTKNKPKLGPRMYVLFIKTLLENPATTAELIELSGLGATTVREYIRALRWAKLIYIFDYTVDVNWRTRSEIWAWGPGMPDKPRPRKKSMAERAAAYRARKKRMKQDRLLSFADRA